MRFTKINPQTRKSRLTRNAPESRKIKEQRSKGLKIKTTRARAPASHENRLSITAFVIISLVKSVAVVFVLLTAVAYSVWLERKVSAHIQNRWGPTRVGPFGLLQPLADGVKFIFKEDLTEPHVYRPLYIAAPIIALVFAITSIAVIPFGNFIDIGPWGTYLQITDVNIGLLVVLGVTSMGVYGVALAGWSSNNKYSLLGGLRASAQMVSYEV